MASRCPAALESFPSELGPDEVALVRYRARTSRSPGPATATPTRIAEWDPRMTRGGSRYRAPPRGRRRGRVRGSSPPPGGLDEDAGDARPVSRLRGVGHGHRALHSSVASTTGGGPGGGGPAARAA